ncbi:MAG: DNA polymerase III subunit delta [Candidatus Marinimicrobia bacterium]|nr:DNA polymerase III subunit delta [Candidatus Neomarinimicrobiota bacterium]
MAFILDELEKIEKGSLAPVYLLYGDDLYLEEEAINTLLAAFSRNITGTVEKQTFYGAEKNDDAFLQSLVNIGMFSSQKLVIYKDLPKLLSSYRKSLLKYLDHPEPSTLLILTSGEGQKSSLFSSVKKHVSVKTLSIWSPPENQFPALIQRKLKKNGLTITPDALEALVLSTNDSLSHAFAEVEKLTVFVSDKKEISIDDVRTVIGGEKSFQMSDFLTAVEKRNLHQAIHICLALIETGIDTPYFISSLYGFFVNVWAFIQINNKPLSYYPAEMRRQQYARAYNNYREHDFKTLFALLLEADIKAKSMSIQNENLMIPLIYQLLK